MTGILAEMPDIRRIEVGLKLREAKVHNGILYNIEAWSNVSDKDMDRLGQVDTAALRAIMGGGHSKCPQAFYFLEFGTLMVKHTVMIRRLMYHYNIVRRDNCETIRKIYLKQIECPSKGDWITLVRNDFTFMEEDFSEALINIQSMSKEQYNKHIKGKVSKAAFKEYIYLKEKCEKKLKYMKYTKFAIQPYLTSKKLSMEEKKLLFSLRSKCYPAKMNSRKQFKGNTQCSLKCRTDETQDHIFEHCDPIRTKIGHNIKLSEIYGTLDDQIRVVRTLLEIDRMRKTLKDKILPGGSVARTHVDT